MTQIVTTPHSEAWHPPLNSSFRMIDANCSVLDEAFRTKSLVRADGEVVPLDVFIPPRQGDLLYSLVRHLKPRQTVEVGLANGISAVHIAKAIEDNQHGLHTAIDPFQKQDWHDVGMATLRRAGLDRFVRLDPRPSHQALPDLEARGVAIQFAFVDGSHLFDYVLSDFLIIDRILDVGGVIAFDDSDWPAIDHVIRFALTNRNYRIFPTGTVIEPSRYTPRLVTRLLRRLVRRTPMLGRRFEHSFVQPSFELGIRGRCVAIEKLQNDDRDCQQRHFNPF